MQRHHAKRRRLLPRPVRTVRSCRGQALQRRALQWEPLQDEYRLPDVYRGYRGGGDQRAALHGEQRLRRRGYLRQCGVSVERCLRQRILPWTSADGARRSRPSKNGEGVHLDVASALVGNVRRGSRRPRWTTLQFFNGLEYPRSESPAPFSGKGWGALAETVIAPRERSLNARRTALNPGVSAGEQCGRRPRTPIPPVRAALWPFYTSDLPSVV